MPRIKNFIKFGRGTLLGLCAVIFLGTSYLTLHAGCAGDCMTCHPKLIGDKDHLAMENCIKCHTPSSQQKIFNLGGGATGECGNDCFQCHNMWPQDGNHAPLNSCKSCHVK